MVWVGKEYNEQKIIELEPTFKVGDRVRIQILKYIISRTKLKRLLTFCIK